MQNAKYKISIVTTLLPLFMSGYFIYFIWNTENTIAPKYITIGVVDCIVSIISVVYNLYEVIHKKNIVLKIVQLRKFSVLSIGNKMVRINLKTREIMY